MFSSLTLDERNNDPKPWWPEGAEYDENRVATGEPYDAECAYWYPRPEFQYGILPKNSILVAFRRWRKDNSLGTLTHHVMYWLPALDMQGNVKVIDESTPDEIIHARRVLTLLSKLTPDS